MIEIYRYSRDGFAPKVQGHHLNIWKEYLKPLDVTGLNDFQRQLYERMHNKCLPLITDTLLDDYQEGVFVFVGGLPQKHWVNHELNHLSFEELQARTLFKSALLDDATVYSVYSIIHTPYNVKEFVVRYGVGFAAYVPKRVLCTSGAINDCVRIPDNDSLE